MCGEWVSKNVGYGKSARRGVKLIRVGEKRGEDIDGRKDSGLHPRRNRAFEG